jgi:hypothetical protein
MSTQKKVVDELPDEEVGALVPDPQVCREFQITSMTLWRRDHDPELKFPLRPKFESGNSAGAACFAAGIDIEEMSTVGELTDRLEVLL